MKKLKVILSKSTGYTYLEAKVVKEHIDALEKRMDKIDSFYDTVVKKIVKKVDKTEIPKCMNCGKPMVNVKDKTTGKISKYLWHCTCWRKDLTLSIG